MGDAWQGELEQEQRRVLSHLKGEQSVPVSAGGWRLFFCRERWLHGCHGRATENGGDSGLASHVCWVTVLATLCASRSQAHRLRDTMLLWSEWDSETLVAEALTGLDIKDPLVHLVLRGRDSCQHSVR